MSGQSFEFTPAGIQPLASPSTQPAGAIIPAAQAVAQIRARVAEQEAEREVAKSPPKQAAKLTGRSLVQQIRARLSEVTTELRRLRRLEREEAELRRLLAAAKQPPASVSDIHRARKSG